MVLIVKLNANFAAMEARLRNAPKAIQSAIHPIMNAAGAKLEDQLVRIISDKTGIDPDAIYSGLIRRDATDLSPHLEIRAEQSRFPYVRWVTAHDDKVCPVCSARDGVIYTTMEIRYDYPAHPNCRCELVDVSLGAELLEAAPEPMAEAVSSITDAVMQAATEAWNR